MLIIATLLATLLAGCAPTSTTQTPTETQPAAGSTSVPVTGGQGNPASPVTLLETGSSLLYPLFSAWAPVIHQTYPNITIQTASTGSGTGISQAVSGVVQFGATDAYMSDSQLSKATGIINIPLAISAQQINYNLPGITTPLNLSGPILAGIYQGNIQYWDDPAIKAANPNANLPHEKIIPVHRTDGSGDTFIFTQYLSFSDSAWNSSIGYNTSVSWPAVQGELGAEGNPGVVQTLAQTPYSIGYVGISFLNEVTSKGLGTAALKNQAGSFVMPTQANISAAAAAMVPKTPKDERVSLIFAPGADSYPIINYEYVAVQTQQSDAQVAAAMRTVLLWAISPKGGNAPSFLDTVHFLPLPDTVAPLSQAQIAQIQ
ncbi:MAG: phosphate ABC transporter substrate-binding protein PstS [Chloroflexi bacterium]|nr:phosphate ABC transporter substrate-binding protein PstS [Chloroflexota bacterium]